MTIQEAKKEIRLAESKIQEICNDLQSKGVRVEGIRTFNIIDKNARFLETYPVNVEIKVTL